MRIMQGSEGCDPHLEFCLFHFAQRLHVQQLGVSESANTETTHVITSLSHTNHSSLVLNNTVYVVRRHQSHDVVLFVCFLIFLALILSSCVTYCICKLQQLTTNMFLPHPPCTALVLPKAEQLLRNNVQPYISSILEALMEPTSRGFSEVREVFFREMVEISKNTLNGGGKEKLGEVSDAFLAENCCSLLLPIYREKFLCFTRLSDTQISAKVR